jgi:DMSO/TMAO reductase YedYZ molybdopterin-dependent catalytic subunit
MKNKNLQTALLLLIFGLSLIASIGQASADTGRNLTVTNLDGTPTNYTYDQLMAMPIINVSAALLCYGNIVTYGVWSGVSLSYLLQQVGVDPTVASIDFVAQDGYAVSIPLQVAAQPNVIIAYGKDGTLLSEGLRLVLPNENGAMWIALITSIKMDTAMIDLNQYSSSTAPGNGAVPQMKTTGQATQPQQTPIQTQPTAPPKKETNVTATPSPTNSVQPTQNTNVPQNSSVNTVMAAYMIAFGGIIASVAATFLIYSRRRASSKRQSQQIS